MRYTVKINRQASRDLTEIFKYIEDREKSTARAERLTNALVDSALGLAQFPYRGQVMKPCQKPGGLCTVTIRSSLKSRITKAR